MNTYRIGCEVGLDFYVRAERASNNYNFQATLIPFIALHIFPVTTSFCERFRTSRCIVLFGNNTIYVKLLINCNLLSVGNSIKTSGSSGCCEYCNVPVSPRGFPHAVFSNRRSRPYNVAGRSFYLTAGSYAMYRRAHSCRQAASSGNVEFCPLRFSRKNRHR